MAGEGPWQRETGSYARMVARAQAAAMHTAPPPPEAPTSALEPHQGPQRVQDAELHRGQGLRRAAIVVGGDGGWAVAEVAWALGTTYGDPRVC